jgi:GMP synthase (glutamine-hydrolysing)
LQHDTIAVIDFGGQYAHLIATKIRRQGVRAEIRQPDDAVDAFDGYRGIIISGSPSLASRGEDSQYTKAIYDLEVPILGFCFGHQELARHYGGQIEHGGREWGKADLHTAAGHPLFRGLDAVEPVWMSHFDSVVSVGPDFEEIGHTISGEAGEHRYAAIGSDSLRRYGFQFHPEVDDTLHGDEMIANFVFEICKCEASWSMEQFLDEQIERVREHVGDRSVFLLASGGVDSTVAAVLLGRAIGPERLHLLHIDNGLMRLHESVDVLRMFTELGLDRNLHFVDASDTFLESLEGLVEPEAKRGKIGDTFVDVFQSEARRLGITHHLLGQGPIYPDTIETGGTKRSETIKTHHNRVPIIQEVIEAGRVVEPLADLYKVEVRELGQRLGIDQQTLSRHPFPGPGLGVRLLCSNGTQDTEGFETIEPQLEELAARFGLKATPLPIRSVGVKADLRAYEHPVLLSGDVDWPVLIDAVSAITAQVPGINRCVWNLEAHHPARATAIEAYVTRERLDVLRKADAIVMEGLRRFGLYDDVWQCPTVLVPLSFTDEPGETVIVRPIRSQRAMTATPVELPPELIGELRDQILKLDGITGLALDVTSKPPGTIEWE